jgi:ribosomal protein S18 acetylase RimI-like enzyme
MKDVREPLAAPDQIQKANFSERKPTRHGDSGLKSSVDHMATETQATGLSGSSQETPDGLSIESRPEFFEKWAPKKDADLPSNGADGASRTADFLAPGAVNSDALVVDFAEPTAQASASGPRREPSHDDPPGKRLDLDLLTPTDWRVLRAARLRALLDSPNAFTSTYARESDWGEPEWRRMFDAAMWIVARDAEKVIGLARTIGEPDQPTTRHIESVWVAPTHRRRGVFRAILLALAELECRMGVTDLLLWVLEDNYAAQCTYEALRFESTGERQFLPEFGRFERRLRLLFGPLQDSEPTGRRLEVDHNGTKLRQRPGLQLEEIHGLAGAADTVEAG